MKAEMLLPLKLVIQYDSSKCHFGVLNWEKQKKATPVNILFNNYLHGSHNVQVPRELFDDVA